MTRRRRPVGASVLLLVLGLALVVPAGIGLAQTPPVDVPAGGGNGAGGFAGLDLRATAAGIDLIYDDEAQAFHPTGQGSVPDTETTLSSGPVGTALASLAWPGPLPADFGSAAQLQGAPPEAGAIRYPVRAQAFAPQGPADVSQGDFVAHADITRTEATAKVQKATSDNGFGVGQATAHSITQTKDGKAIAEATSVVNNFSLAGAITIDSVTTVAKVTSDAKVATTEGKTTVSGFKVAGQPATITDKGITFSDQTNPSPLDAVKQQVADQALKAAGISVYVSQPVVEKDGPGATYTSGSVVITWVPQPGQLFTYRLGGAVAKATANQEQAVPVPEEVPVPEVASTPTETPTAPASAPAETPVTSGAESTGSGAAPTESAPTASAPPPDTGGGDGGGEAVALEATPAAFFGGLSPGTVLAFVAGAGLIGAAMRRLADNVLAVTDGSTCPLDAPERTSP